MNELHARFLSNHRIFNFLGNSEIAELCSSSELIVNKKGSYIYSNEKANGSIYFLNQGRIKIGYFINPDQETIAEILTEGDVFGMLTLTKNLELDGEYAQVLSDAAIISKFEIEYFQSLLKKYSELGLRFSQMLSFKLQSINRKYCHLIFKDVRWRILNFFILHAENEGKWNGDHAIIETFCTHQVIADFTATSRQTVTTVIKALLEEKKIIYERRNKVVIPDIKALYSLL